MFNINVKIIFEFLQTLCFLLVLTTFPLSKTHKEDFRNFSKTTVIEIQKSSPLFAAYVESQDHKVELLGDHTTEVHLAAGGTVIDMQALLDSKKKMNLPKLESHAFYLGKIYGALSKITPSEVVEAIQTKEMPILKIASASLAPPLPDLKHGDGSLLPVSERKQKLISYYKNNPIDKSEGTWKELAKPMLASAEDSMSGESESSRTIFLSSNRKIKIKKGTIPFAKAKKSKTSKNKSSKENPKPNSGDLAINEIEPTKETGVYLAGNIQLTEGLAFSPDMTLEIFIEREGLIVSDATIDWQKGTYIIRADQLDGYLVAELRDENGENLSLYEKDLYTLNEEPLRQNNVETLDIELSPLVEGLKVKVISARSFKDHVIDVKDAKFFIEEIEREVLKDKNNHFVDQSFQKGSTLLARVSSKGYWDTLANVYSGIFETLKLYPKTSVDALYGLAGNKERAKGGVIWGQVLKNGSPVKNARVEIAGNNYSKPIYFKNIFDGAEVPDVKLNSTGDNGSFSFIHLTPGEYGVRVTIEGTVYPATLVSVEEESISYLPLNIEGKKFGTLVVNDPIKGVNELGAAINVYGAEMEIDVPADQVQKLSWPKMDSSVALEVDAGPAYEVVRTQLHKNTRHLEALTIPKGWVLSEKFTENIKLEEEKGIVVGFVQNDDFSVFVNQVDGQDENIHIVYFDHVNEVIESGQKGGGFVIYNMPPIQKSIAIVSEGGTKISNQRVFTEPGIPEVLNIKF